MSANKFLIFLVVAAFIGCSSHPSVKKTDTATPVDTDDISDLRARLDDLNNKVYVLTEQMESLRSKNRDSSSSTVQPSVQQTKTPVAEVEKSSNSMEKEYTDAYALYKDKKYAKALIAFSTFIEKYPDTVLTDNAYYWTAQCYFEQKEYTLAIDEFTKVLRKFPKESKAPEAMLSIARAYNELGEKKEADSYLKELISRFPASRAAYTAKNMVENKK